MKKPKGSLNARRSSTRFVRIPGSVREAASPSVLSPTLALAGYDFTEFAAFLRASDPVWVSGQQDSLLAIRSAKKGGTTSR